MNLLLLAAILAAVPGAPQPRGRVGLGSRVAKTEVPPYLQFAPTSGFGLPVAENLCDALAAEVPTWATPVGGGAGNWCLGGDGLAVVGSQVAFTVVGAPAAVDMPVCPSGLDCATKPSLQLTGTQYTQSATTPKLNQAFSACVWHQNAASTAESTGIFGRANTAGGAAITVRNYFARLTKNNGAIQDFYPSAYNNSLSLICLSYAYVTDVTSRFKMYLNGVSTVNASNAHGPLNDVDGLRTFAYREEGFGNNLTGNGLGAFYLDQELSAAQIAAISRRVLADQPKALINGFASLPLTYTRTGSRFCSRADNTGSIVPSGRPCVSRGGILAEGTATNLIFRSQELSTAPWSVGGYTVTPNYALAPDSTMTAERVLKVTPGLIAAVNQTITATASTSTASIYLKGTSGSGSICLHMYPTAVATSCTFNATSWTRCSVTGGAGTTNIALGYNYAGCVTPDGTDVLAWGAQVESGSVATSYTPTTSAAAVRATDATILNTGLLSPFPVSMAATYTPWDGTNITGYKHLLEWYRSGGSRDALIVCPAGNTIGLEGGGSGCYLPVPYGVPASDMRLSLVYSAAAVPLISFCVGSNCSSGVLSTSQPATGTAMFLAPHFYSGTVQPPGSFVWSNVCLDPNPRRCR